MIQFNRTEEPKAASNPVLDVTQIGIKYASVAERRSVLAVRDASFAIQREEIVAIVGASGCGKTSILNAIAGLIPIYKGAIRLDQVPVAAPGPERAVVFQRSGLFPWKSLLDNVAYGLKLQGATKSECKERGLAILRRFGLDNVADRFPHELSGGMQQRGNLARALLVKPKLLLLDEPFAAVDAQTREVLQNEVTGVLEEVRATGLIVTHQIDEAVLFADQVLIMSMGPGSVIEATVDIPLERPRRPNVKQRPQFGELVDTITGKLKRSIQPEATWTREPLANE